MTPFGYRPRHLVEYAALRGFAAVARCLPYRAALAWAWLHAALFFHVFRFRVAEVRGRIRAAFGGRYTSREMNRIAWQSWRNMCFNAVELLRLRPEDPDSLPPHIDADATIARAREHVATGRGAVFACPHFGNWELAGLLIPHSGIEMFTVTGVMKNPLVQRYIQRIRHAPNVALVERGRGGIRTIIRNLKAGQVMALMPDLRSRLPGVPVRFLGGVANTYPGMGAFARQAGVPVFLGVMRRESWTRHRFDHYGPYEPDPACDKEADIARLTQAVFDDIERIIREDPGQWFWFNKRWILEPLPGAHADAG